MPRPLRLLTVGHSYAVALNRRLPHELARAGTGRWEVTAAAPEFVQGDLRPVPLERFADEANRLAPVAAYLTARPHVTFYGRALQRLFAEPWDLIHCWVEPYVLAAAQFARWAAHRPLVYYTFQNIPKRYPPPFNWVERAALRRAAGWLAAGQTVTAALRNRNGYAEKPHRVMPLGVDVEAFRPDASAGAAVRRSIGWEEGGPPVVGYLGRFIPVKGLGVLMAALDSLRTPWRALFVGGGAMERELRAWAGRYADARVRVMTGVPHDAVPAYLNAMDVLAAPSQTTPVWKEQLGRMLIEAMACGVPVVGSYSGEIPFVIGDAGLLLPEADAGAWSECLDGLLASHAGRLRLKAAGLDRVDAMFAWPIVARAHLEFFNQLLGGRSG